MGQLQANLNTLKTVESKQADTDIALQNIETRFQQIEGGLTGHGALLNTLSETQTQQGELLNTLNSNIDNLTHITSHITGNVPPVLLLQRKHNNTLSLIPPMANRGYSTMSTPLKGPSQNDDPKIIKSHSASNTSITINSQNTNNNTNVKCYLSTPKSTRQQQNSSFFSTPSTLTAPLPSLSSDNNNKVPTAPIEPANVQTSTQVVIQHTQTTDISPEEVHQNQEPPTSVPTLPIKRHTGTRGRRAQKLSTYLKACEIQSINTHPPESLPPVSAPRPFTGSNPYRKPPPNRNIVDTIDQLAANTCTSSSITASGGSSHTAMSAPTTPFRMCTRTGLVKSPQRLGFSSPAPSASSSSADSDAYSSSCSPMEESTSCAPHESVDIASFIAQELDDISELTRSLNEMMSTTAEIINVLQQNNNLLNNHTVADIPAEICTTTSSRTRILTQPEIPASNHVDQTQADIEESFSLSSEPRPFPAASTTSSSTTSQNEHNSAHIDHITPDYFTPLLDDIRYKTEGDYRIVLQNTNGISKEEKVVWG